MIPGYPLAAQPAAGPYSGGRYPFPPGGTGATGHYPPPVTPARRPGEPFTWVKPLRNRERRGFWPYTLAESGYMFAGAAASGALFSVRFPNIFGLIVAVCSVILAIISLSRRGLNALFLSFAIFGLVIGIVSIVLKFIWIG